MGKGRDGATGDRIEKVKSTADHQKHEPTNGGVEDEARSTRHKVSVLHKVIRRGTEYAAARTGIHQCRIAPMRR